MAPGVHVVLSGCLTFGVPLVMAIRELMVLRRGGGGAWPGDPTPEMPPLPKPLPDCLIPRRDLVPPQETVRPRIPELV
jgi:hypothetical protein